MNPFIMSVFSPKSGQNPVTPTGPVFEDYEVGFFKVVDNYVGGKLSANTGISYDKNRRLIYSSITPGSSGNVAIFNEDYEFQGYLNFSATQGHAFNALDDVFYIWVGSSLQTRAYDGTLLKSQSFNPYGDGTPSGALGYNHVDNELLISADGSLDVLVFVKDENDDWVFDRSLGNGDAQEGVCYDEDDDCYWYNMSTLIQKISKTGERIKTIPQTNKTINVCEGLAYNTNRKTLYINSDKGYHGSITDGNRCVEVWPGFYE